MDEISRINVFTLGVSVGVLGVYAFQAIYRALVAASDRRIEAIQEQLKEIER